MKNVINICMDAVEEWNMNSEIFSDEFVNQYEAELIAALDDVSEKFMWLIWRMHQDQMILYYLLDDCTSRIEREYFEKYGTDEEKMLEIIRIYVKTLFRYRRNLNARIANLLWGEEQEKDS